MRPGCASHVYTPLYTPAVQRCPCAVCAILNLLFSRQSFVNIIRDQSRPVLTMCGLRLVAPLRSTAPVKTVALGSVARVDSRHAPVSARSPKKRLRIRTLKTIKTSRPFAYPPGWDRPSSPGAAVSSTPCHPASPGCDRPRPVSQRRGSPTAAPDAARTPPWPSVHRSAIRSTI